MKLVTMQIPTGHAEPQQFPRRVPVPLSARAMTALARIREGLVESGKLAAQSGHAGAINRLLELLGEAIDRPAPPKPGK